eukprot:1824863-Prymnesium_polylepis.1
MGDTCARDCMHAFEEQVNAKQAVCRRVHNFEPLQIGGNRCADLGVCDEGGLHDFGEIDANVISLIGLQLAANVVREAARKRFVAQHLAVQIAIDPKVLQVATFPTLPLELQGGLVPDLLPHSMRAHLIGRRGAHQACNRLSVAQSVVCGPRQACQHHRRRAYARRLEPVGDDKGPPHPHSPFLDLWRVSGL